MCEYNWLVRNKGEMFPIRQVRTMKESQTMCRGLVGDDLYWKNLYRDLSSRCKPGSISHVVYAMERNKPMGFALIQSGKRCVKVPGKAAQFLNDQSGVWYLELICSAPGFGSKLLDEVIRRAKLDRIRMITLAALPAITLWYHKRGFKFNISANRENREFKNLIERVGHQTFASRQQALRDKNMKSLLEYAVTQGLATDSGNTLDARIRSGVYMSIFFNKRQFKYAKILEHIPAASPRYPPRTKRLRLE